jgi:acyl-CoA thioesterase I
LVLLCSYRDCRAAVHIACLLAMLLAGSPLRAEAAGAPDRLIRIVALGDSLTAGLGLPLADSFPSKLEARLKAKGTSVEIINAGVSGDTASAGLARLDWSVPEKTDAAIVEFGGNDMLLGLKPSITRSALSEIVRRLRTRGMVVLLAGMRAAPNLGIEYGREFEQIFPDIAAKNDALLYPFFLEGVAADAKFNQGDGVHPTAAGVEVIIAGILPMVEELIGQVRHKPRS